MELKWLSIYNEDAWERMVAESCGSAFTDAHCQRIFKKKYAVCVETRADRDIIIYWTDDRNYPLKQGQFLVDAETLQVVNQYDLKGLFDRMHQRLRDNISKTLT